MSTYQQQLAKCKDTNEDYSNIWRSSVWTISDYEELFEDIDRGYIIQSQEANYFIINPDWEEEEEDSDDEEEVEDSERYEEEKKQRAILHSQSVWKIYFGAVLQDIREPNWREEEEENKCWGNNKCERDEFGCCIVCCECKECIKRIKEEHVTLEEQEQYKKVCDEEGCETILDIDTPIMCYMNNHNGDKTLCRTCYDDGDYKEDDENSDNYESDDEE